MRARWLLVAVLVATASATTLRPMSIERLTNASSDVVVARAEDSWTEWNAARTVIYTITRFRVQRAWKGAAPETVLVKQTGGKIGNLQQKVAGVRHWGKGERAVLFLRPSKERGGAFAVTGLVQGNFRVIRQAGEELVTNDAAGVETVHQQGRIGELAGKRMTLADLEARVRRAATR